jgi:uroporphyrinogen decarboxylase
MTSRQRLLTALDRGKPDRLPVTVHQWQPYHLAAYLGGIGELEAFVKFGLDAQVQYSENAGRSKEEALVSVTSTGEWRIEADVLSRELERRIVRYTVTTPEGRLTWKTEGNLQTTWITEYLVKRDEDIELVGKYMPVPQCDLKAVAALSESVGDAGIVRGYVWGDQAGCWQHACCLADANDLILATFDKPDWVHRFLGILLEKKLRFVESMKGARFDLVETGGGAASSTLISPALHAAFCLPYDRRLHEALRGLGFRIVYHTCGGTLGIEEHIVANGCDASETLAPPSIGGNQEPWQFAAKVRGRLALIGGLDQNQVLNDGAPDLIRFKVRELFEKVGGDGGYILSLSDHFFDTPPEKLAIYAAAGRSCVYGL